MNVRHDVRAATRRSVTSRDVQLCLAVALLVGAAVWLNRARSGAEARAVSYEVALVQARAEYGRETAVARGYGQQLERGQRSTLNQRPGDSLSRSAAALVRLGGADAAAKASAAAARIPPLLAGSQAAVREARWFAAGMVAVLALAVLPAWRWRRAQRRGPRDVRAAGSHG